MQYPWPYPYLTHQPPPTTAPTFPIQDATSHASHDLTHASYTAAYPTANMAAYSPVSTTTTAFASDTTSTHHPIPLLTTSTKTSTITIPHHDSPTISTSSTHSTNSTGFNRPTKKPPLNRRFPGWPVQPANRINRRLNRPTGKPQVELANRETSGSTGQPD